MGRKKSDSDIPVPIKKTRRKNKWRYTETEQLMILAFLKALHDDAAQALARARRDVATSANEHTAGQALYWKNAVSAIEWAVYRVQQGFSHEKIPTTEV